MEIFDQHYFSVNKALLKSTGLWPYESRRRKFCIRTFINLILGVFVIFPQLVRIYNYFGVNMDMVLEHAAILLFILTTYLKFLTSVYYEEKLKVVYDNIAKNWQAIKDENEVNILSQYSESGWFLTISYIMYIVIAASAYSLLPMAPVLLDMIDPLNETRPRLYILGGEYFIVDNVEDYGKVYAFELVPAAVTVWLICAVDSMYAASIEHCLGLLAIVNFTDILESSYSSSFLILVGVNVLFLSFECIIVLTRFGQTMELIRYSMIMVGIVVHLFYLSWPGQKLTDLSIGLFQDAYLNEWYTCSTRAQKLLNLMILRCSKPCQLTAGGIYVMNFSNFAKIVKTSMSYMTVFASFR